MRPVLFVALCGLVACRADRPDSVSSPPLVVEADCSVQGEACEVAGAMCPVQGVCRDGRCVPSVLGELPPATPWVGFAGDIGAMDDDGSVYLDDSYEAPARLAGNGAREDTAGVHVRQIIGRIGVGLADQGLSAIDLDTRAVLWTAPLDPPYLAWGSEVADTGRGVVAVASVSGGRDGHQSALVFHRLADGQVLRRHTYEAEPVGLAASEGGRVFLRLREQTCQVHAFTHDGAPLWTRDSTCTNDGRLVTHRERLFDGATVRDGATGDALFELDDGFSVWLASDDVLVAHAHRGIVKLRDPVTFERHFRQAGAGLPFALTSRGTLLTASSDSYYVGNWCVSDCMEDVGEIREYTFDGGLIGLCDRRSDLVPYLAGGVLWIGYSSHATDGYTAHPVPGYDLAPRGWVAPHGTPGAQRRPR